MADRMASFVESCAAICGADSVEAIARELSTAARNLVDSDDVLVHLGTFTKDSPPRGAAFPIPARDGSLVGLLIVPSGHTGVSDDQAKALEALASVAGAATERLQCSLLERISDLLPACVAYVDRDVTYRHVNALYRDWFGVEPQTIVGRSVPELLGAEAYALREEYVHRALAGEIVTFEARLTLPDGRCLDTETVYIPDVRDGQVRGFVSKVRDITAQREAERALTEAEDHHRFRLQASPQIPWLADSEGRIFQFGSQWLDLTGLSAVEAIRTQLAVVHQEDLPLMNQAWQLSVDTGEPFLFEHRVRVKDGSFRWVRSRAVPRLDGGKVIRWYGTTEDIHEIRAAHNQIGQIQESLMLAMKGGRMGWWTRNTETNEVTWSAELEALFGLSPGAFAGTEQSFFDFVHPEDRPLVGQAVEEAMASGEDYAVEFRIRRADGSEGWMEGRGRAVYGTPTMLYGLGIDITERKRAEESVRQSEARLRSLIEQSPISIQTFGPDGASLTANRAWQQLWESHPSQLIGYNVLQDSQLEAKGVFEYILKAYAGEPQRIAPVLYDPAEIGRVGRPRWVGARVYPVYQPNGELQEVVLLLEDVTSALEAVEALRQSEDRFRTIAESVPQFIFGARTDGTTDYMNPQLEEFLGGPSSGLENAWTDAIHPEDREHIWITWQSCLESGDEYVVEGRMRRAGDRQYRWCRAMARPIRDRDGQIVRWYGILSDIHEEREQSRTLERLVRERTAELEAAYREQESFSYSVSHDLRAPLRSIVATVRMIQEDHGESLPEDVRTLLERQAQSALNLAQLIDDLLQLSRVGRQDLAPADVDLSSLFLSVGGELVTKPGLSLYVEPNLTARGDSRLLRLLAQNLLENASKFSPEGGEIRVGRSNDAFFVSDQGVGFDPTFGHKLFQPFQRLHPERQFAGTGIGLATVRRIVERHGGRVWAESQPGHGATFWFTLAP